MNTRDYTGSLMEREAQCNLCGHIGARMFLPRRHRLGEKYFDWVRCGGCGIIRIAPLPTPDEINRMYSAEEYIEGASITGHTGGRALVSDLIYADARRQLEGMAQHAPEGRLLDVGCAHGEFLRAAADLGYEAEGIEPSPTMAAVTGDRGLRVYESTLENVELPAGRYNIVNLGDVVEHLVEPVAMMQKVHELLAPGGIVHIRVPTALNSLYFKAPVHLVRLTRALGISGIWEGSSPPHHLWEFTPRLLRLLLEKAGFEVLYSRAAEGMPRIGRDEETAVTLWHARTGRDCLRIAAAYPLKALSVMLARLSSLGDRSEALGRKAENAGA